MSTNIKILLDKRKQKSDKTYPLIIRIIHNRKSISIPLGYSLVENDWNDDANEVKKSYSGVSNTTRLNKLIQQQKINAMDIVNQLQDSGEIDNLSVREIKNRIVSQKSGISFYTFSEEIIEEMKGAERFGYARSINDTLQVVRKFKKNTDFTFQQLNYTFLVQFENDCRGRGTSLNSIAVFMRTIKMIYNRAIKAGIVKQEQYPFKGYKIKTTKTKKRAVRRDVISLIENLILPEQSRIWHAKNYFLFSFYAMGINFADIAHLKMNNIIDGRLEFTRQKTRKDYSIRISNPIQNILNLYCKNKNAEDYIFPIITQEGLPEQEYRQFIGKRRMYNIKLKEIANLCGIESNLTSYVARHSWATIAKRKGVPVAAISEGMGHGDVKTTEIYLDSFDKEVLDDYNDLITG